MKKLLILLIMGLVITPVFAQQIEALRYDSIPQYGMIAGKVCDANTGKPIVGAYVSAHNDDPYVDSAGAYTDSKGRYIIENLLIGIYSVTADARGYEPQTKDNILVTTAQITSVDFWLRPSSGPQYGSISGIVRNINTGLPINGAHVVAQGPGYGHAYTDSAGFYRINNLDPGSYSVTASKSGYEPGTADSVIVIADQNTPNVNFWLKPTGGSEYGSISGFVWDNSTGLPIKHAYVEALGGPSYGHVYSDSTGAYQIQQLTAGWYIVKASAPGYLFATSGDSIIVLAGHDTPNVNFWLVPITPQYGSISGFVRDDSTGLPIEYALAVAEGPSNSEAYTDSIGHYYIANLAQGVYSVTASASGYQSQTKDSIGVYSGQNTEVNFWLVQEESLKFNANTMTMPGEDPHRIRFNVSPNPFKGMTRISWQITKETKTRLQIIDVTGRVVKNWIDSSPLEPGLYSRTWDGKDEYGRLVAEGVYIINFATNEASLTTKLIFLK